MSESQKILVIDDEPANRFLVEAMLESLGYTLDFAESGLEGLEKLSPDTDLVLLDVIMPGMDGFEVARRIRIHPDFMDIPIIMVTVLGSKEDRLRAVEVGANDFIAKPIERVELQVRVASLLKMKQAQDTIKLHRAELEATVEKRTSALREIEKRLRTLIEAAQDWIFVKDRDLEYAEVNAALVELLQIPYERIVGQTDEDLFGTDYAAQAKDIEFRVLEGQTIESRHSIWWGGQRINFDVIRFPLKDERGVVTGICGIAREVVTPLEMPIDTAILDHEYRSAAMQSTMARARLAANSDSIILLTGESGSGKDYLARHIHDHSPRSVGPFYSLNCAAIPEQLAESELFGHEAGAFTGAVRRKRGLLELAEGGTVLLNEVGDLPELLQAKLLMFLDTFSFTRVGGEKAVKVNLRLIAATNKDLAKEVPEGRFRKDLFYRLNVFVIGMPPLRDRSEDIPLLVDRLLVRIVSDLRLQAVPRIHPSALDMLCRYTWPGNVRELRNVLERGLILSRGGPLTPAHIGLEHFESGDGFPARTFPLSRPLPDILDEIERPLIQEALRQSKGQKYGASRLLGISRYVLARRMRNLGISER